MNKHEKIEQEIQKTLAQLDTMEKLPPNPFFYTRVRQRMDEKARTRQKSIAAVLLKPALMTLLLAMNIGTAVWYLGGTTETASGTATSQPRQELIQLLVNDFQLDSTQDNWLTME